MSRLLKIASLLKKEISSILLTRINNNKIGFITIISVEVAKDFSIATVYYSQIGSENEIQETKKALKNASKFIYFELCKVIKHMKTLPKLIFVYDKGIQRGTEIINKMQNLN
tara:strand:- start:770 stop:1105 length:336 start_codon:yes stop_codon:yes gene_type:complete